MLGKTWYRVAPFDQLKILSTQKIFRAYRNSSIGIAKFIRRFTDDYVRQDYRLSGSILSGL